MTSREANEVLVGDLRLLMNDAEELLRATADVAGEKVDALRHRLGTAIESAKANCARIPDKAVETARTTDHLIRAHLYESLGLALGLGLMVGALAWRR